ncbi:MAG TPA: hypothetical protein VKB69_14205 [Micromonosporaceae bacterium]|nr:hypothetical protein [Micromonosporaceae bacterium]
MVFLVERYLPSVAATEVADAARRLAADPGTVRHLLTLFIPGEDTGLSLVDGPDPAAVAAANARAGFAYTRIVPALLVGSDPLPTSGAQ